MNPFNAFTELLKWRDYINNADLLQQQLTFELANEWRNCISSSLKTKSIFNTFDILLLLLLLYFLLFFFQMFVFSIKTHYVQSF